jgi:hypothetical protein
MKGVVISYGFRFLKCIWIQPTGFHFGELLMTWCLYEHHNKQDVLNRIYNSGLSTAFRTHISILFDPLSISRDSENVMNAIGLYVNAQKYMYTLFGLLSINFCSSRNECISQFCLQFPTMSNIFVGGLCGYWRIFYLLYENVQDKSQLILSHV